MNEEYEGNLRSISGSTMFIYKYILNIKNGFLQWPIQIIIKKNLIHKIWAYTG